MPDDSGQSRNYNDEPYTGWYGYRSSNAMDLHSTLRSVTRHRSRLTARRIPTYRSRLLRPTATCQVAPQPISANAYYYKYKGTQSVTGWAYTKNGVVNNTFYGECSTSTSSNLLCSRRSR